MSRPRKVVKELLITDPHNMQHIAEDATKAKSTGVSYGKYKAGIGVDFEESEYPVSNQTYLRPVEVSDSVKAPVAVAVLR